jgi:hypothetical protein
MSKNTNWQKEFEEKFGTLTCEQLWLLTKFAKNARLRCRNNAALYNHLNSAFPNARFREVIKTRKNRYSGVEESYPGLSIQMKLEDGTTKQHSPEEDED